MAPARALRARTDDDDYEDIKPALSPAPDIASPASPPLREISPQEVLVTLTPSADASTPLSATSARHARKAKAGKNAQSENGVPPTPGRFPPRNDDDERQCTNCGEVDTPQWRGTLCNACALWKRARGSDRPLPLKFPVRKRARSVTPGVGVGEEDVEMGPALDFQDSLVREGEGEADSRGEEEVPSGETDGQLRSPFSPAWRGRYRRAHPGPYARPMSRQSSYPGMRPTHLVDPASRSPQGYPRVVSARPASTPASPARRVEDGRFSPLRDLGAMPPHMAILARAAQMISSMEERGGDDEGGVARGRRRAATVSGDEEAEAHRVSLQWPRDRVAGVAHEDEDTGAGDVRGAVGEVRYAVSPSPGAGGPMSSADRGARTGVRPVSVTPSISRLGRRRSTLLGWGSDNPQPSRSVPLPPLPSREEFMHCAEVIYGLLERTEVAIETLAAMNGRRDAASNAPDAANGRRGQDADGQ